MAHNRTCSRIPTRTLADGDRIRFRRKVDWAASLCEFSVASALRGSGWGMVFWLPAAFRRLGSGGSLHHSLG